MNLAPLTTAEARQEVCTDRNNLLAEGFPATSFAYPFGSFDSGTELVVGDCGYNSGRGVAGISKTGPFAETIPPLDLYATRTPPNPKKSTKLSTLQQYVLNAEANGGGWVQFVFHRLCEQCGPYAITPAKFTALLDFLQGEVASGRVDGADDRAGHRRPGTTAGASVREPHRRAPARGGGRSACARHLLELTSGRTAAAMLQIAPLEHKRRA